LSRNRQRACLQDGLKLDINRLARDGFIRAHAGISGGPIPIWGEVDEAL